MKDVSKSAGTVNINLINNKKEIITSLKACVNTALVQMELRTIHLNNGIHLPQYLHRCSVYVVGFQSVPVACKKTTTIMNHDI